MSILPKRILTVGVLAAAVYVGRGSWSDLEPGRGRGAGDLAGATPAFALGAIQPRLSASGEQVVFSYQGAIWRAPRTGGTMTRLTTGTGFDIEPAWSPDASRIAYINSSGYFWGTLQLARAEDGAAIPIPRDVTANGKLAFDPDGKRLLGVFSASGQPGQLAWCDLATGALTPIPIGDARTQRYALSRDGRNIAFITTQDRPGEQSGNNGPAADVWLVAAHGGAPSRLVRFPARIHELCWTADGAGLIVSTELGGAHQDLWHIPLADPEKGANRLTFAQADEDRPSVSDDGRWLVYSDNRSGPTALMARDLSSGRDTPIEITSRDQRSPKGRLRLALIDAADRSPTTARVVARHESGKYPMPPGSLYRLHKGDLHFYVSGGVDYELPAGRHEISAARGPEYRVARRTIDVRPGEIVSTTLELTRWTDQRARGWFPGESHIHANYGYGSWYNTPRAMLLQCAGEDMAVSNFMVANSDGDGIFDREHFRGRPDPLSDGRTILRWNEEFRSTIWGHMTLLNLTQLVEPIDTGFLHTTHPYDAPTNADVSDLTHDQNGLVNYTHPAANVSDPYLGAYTAKALPMDVAHGKVDSVDIMGTNHEAALPLWYRLLNCGFRIPASAGTDCFLNRIPSKLPGSDRAFVKVEGGFTYEHWIEGLKAGRTFVTNGPMLEFTVDGREPGAVLRVAPGGSARVRAKATSAYPLTRIELIQDGKVVASSDAAGDGLAIEIERALPFERSGWVAVRALGPGHRDLPGASAFAHTSAIHVEVPDRPVDARADAAYFMAWIDRLAGDVRARNRIPTRRQAHVESLLSAARAVYSRKAGQP